MKNSKLLWSLALCAATLTACGKKAPPPAPEVAATPAPSPAPAPPPVPAQATAPAPPAAEPTDEQRERAEKLAKLDYATMEDGFINDPHGQWAASVIASSTFGDDGGKEPSSGNLAANMAGAPDGKSWTNNHQDMGFDSITAAFAKPVSVTEVRVVCTGNHAANSISKVELQGTDDSWHTAWSGLSDAKLEQRGPRVWFVRTFAKTTHQVKAVKVTFANAVSSGYKEVDAVQLVGE